MRDRLADEFGLGTTRYPSGMDAYPTESSRPANAGSLLLIRFDNEDASSKWCRESEVDVDAIVPFESELTRKEGGDEVCEGDLKGLAGGRNGVYISLGRMMRPTGAV